MPTHPHAETVCGHVAILSKLTDFMGKIANISFKLGPGVQVETQGWQSPIKDSQGMLELTLISFEETSNEMKSREKSVRAISASNSNRATGQDRKSISSRPLSDRKFKLKVVLFGCSREKIQFPWQNSWRNPSHHVAVRLKQNSLRSLIPRCVFPPT
jgi:hypothetical protein